jgi:methyl-accepting chemotaxis protein PixJ
MLNSRLKQSSQVSNSEAKTFQQPPRSPHQHSSGKQRHGQPWNNFSFRTKLAILLMTSTALPIISLTQGLVALNKDHQLVQLKKALEKDGRAFTQEYVLWTQVETETQAENIGKLIQATNIDLSNSSEVLARRAFLQDFLAIHNGIDPESNKNFQILTDAQGRTVAQDIQILADDFSNQPALLAKNAALAVPKYSQVSLPTGINLRDIPIVKNALRTGRPLSGMELLKSSSLQLLGLEKQANIGWRSQPIKNLSQAKQPFPEGTYDIDEGKAGLVSMAVYPIKIRNKLVGTVVVGALQNRNYALVDKFSQNYDVPTATVFARDWRVSTNVPYSDGKTRAVGTRVAREVAETVLNRGREFSGQTNIVGQNYLTFYAPIYDHQKELNPTKAKPIGISYIGQSLEQVEGNLRNQQLTAYAIGGGMLLLVGLVAIPLAGTFSRPLKRLAIFAQQLGVGETGIRLEETSDRHDEIGILSQELNQMAANIEASLEARRQEAESAQFFGELVAQTRDFQTIEDVLAHTVKAARNTLQAERIVVYRFNPDWSGAIVAEAAIPGLPPCLNTTIADTCMQANKAEEYRKGRVRAIDDIYRAGLTDCHVKFLERLRIKANLVAPILKNDELFGLVFAQYCSKSHTWEQAEINFLERLGVQLGSSLHRVSLLQNQQEEAKRTELLKDITLKIAQTNNLQDVFSVATNSIRQAIATDRVAIYGLDPTNWKGTIIAESVANGFPVAMGAEIEDPCLRKGQVERYKQGQVTSISDIYNEPRVTACYRKQLEQFSVKANLVAPIVRGNQLFGLLIAHHCSSTRVWQQQEMDFFRQLATQVGLALDRASLLEQQKSAREFMQRRALELLMEVDPVSRGDLTVRANVTEDEIGTIADSYNATINSLRKIVSQVQAAARQVSSTTSSSEHSVSELSQEALRQTEAITAALERIQQMSDSIRAVATSASQAEAVVQQATQTVVVGDTAMNRTVEGMMAIRETVTATSKKVKQLGESSQKISKVVNLIGRFAAQTNLLALKASIEAARAGEEGRGFAVLADEVRVLARQSAEATAEIESLIANIQAETNEVVAAMEAGTEQVVAGTRLVDETRQSLNQISAASQQISELVAAIASAAALQSQTSQVVTATMTDVVAIADRTSNEAKVVSSSFKELSALAQELQASVSQFKVSG